MKQKYSENIKSSINVLNITKINLRTIHTAYKGSVYYFLKVLLFKNEWFYINVQKKRDRP